MIRAKEWKYVPASEDWLRRLLKGMVPRQFFMVYRLPFSRTTKLTYPDHKFNPDNPDDRARCKKLLKHEKYHIDFNETWWGPWMVLLWMIFPFPVLFSGRWFLERGAFLVDIRNQRVTVEEAVECLWVDYKWAWPKPLMRRWFQNEIAKDLA